MGLIKSFQTKLKWKITFVFLIILLFNTVFSVWFIVSPLRDSDLFSIHSNVIANVIIKALSANMILTSVGIIIIHRITNRISLVVSAAKMVSDANYTKLIKADSIDEFGQLAQIVNKLVLQIQESNKQISEKNHFCEHQAATLDKLMSELDQVRHHKDEFLSVISHELRTPLHGIIGYQDLLAESDELNDEDLVRLEGARRNAKRLLVIINDILSICKLERGGLEHQLDPISLQDFVTSIESKMDVLAQEKQLEFHIAIDSTLPDMIVTNENAISKIVTNLLSNAFKFTHDGGVTLSLLRNLEEWQIVVEDTGIGIAADKYDMIFEYFQQIDGSITRQYEGIGLGLTLVQKLCQAMNGTVEIESELNIGSRFTVTLPLVSVQNKEML